MLCWAKLLQLCLTLCDLWTVAHHTPLSMGFSRQEYWSGLPCPPPGYFSLPRDHTHVSYISCIGRRVLYHQHHLHIYSHIYLCLCISNPQRMYMKILPVIVSGSLLIFLYFPKCFVFSLTMTHDLQDLSSLTRDQTWALSNECTES